MRVYLIGLALILAAAADVRGEVKGEGGADWTRGMVSAVGAAPGDVRAPSPAMARVKAEREAREAAREKLLPRVRELPLAAGGTVGDAVDSDAEAAARLERAVARSLDLEVDYGSDGSVVLTSGVPLEAVRVAVFGIPRPPAGAKEQAPTALIVDARRVLAEPSLGIELRAGQESFSGPTIFYRRPALAGRDARLGARPERVKARGAKEGALLLEEGAPLAEAKRAGALVVVLLKSEKGRNR